MLRITPRRWTSQPQFATGIDWSNPITWGLVFAFNPAIGYFDLVTKIAATGITSPTANTLSKTGVMYAGGVAGFSNTIPSTNGLTLFSIWKARPDQYRAADGTRIIASNRNGSNAGWSWGKDGAIGGGSGGNLTRQSLVFGNVAQYSEANYVIPSLFDTPVATRYTPSSNTVSWFANGAKSSSDTAVGANSAGTTLTFGAQGPYGGGNLGPWIDNLGVVFIFSRALSDAEIASLSANPWQIFSPALC